MNSFAAAYHGTFLPTPTPPSHNRTVSLGPHDPLPTRKSISKARSTTALRQANMSDSELDRSFQTLHDPRNNDSKNGSRRASSTSRHPGLIDEVATLSDKLISAINHQQKLDDSLNQTRHELEAAKAKIAELEAKEKEQQERISNGDLVSKDEIDKLKAKSEAEVAEEKKQKQQALQEKKGMEAELENLTASLFEEANKLVATANREKSSVDKKNQQLRDQIKDGEALIASQTEQLTELKILMQQIQTDHRKEMTDSPRTSLAPSTPAVDKEDSANVARLLEAMNMTLATPALHFQPTSASKLTHLIRTECRKDIPAYDDFHNLLQTSNHRSYNPSHASSRAGSGTYGGLNVMGLGSMYGTNNGSNPNVAQSGTSKANSSPSLPGSFSPRPSTTEIVPLKETRFFKRVMTEDIEPTLRLDLSPAISWLSRRTILAAVGDNVLSVEPIPEASIRLNGRFTSCSLCGDSRKEGQNPRTHAMRVREGEGATKWPICTLCLEKVRAVGDLVSYVRMVRDGVVKIGDQKEEEEAWEELVRLRERLFWARMAGGVVPAFIPSNKNSPVVEFSNDGRVAESENKENKTPGPETPDDSPRVSNDRPDATEEEDEEEDEASRQARFQLQAGLEHVTTFQNAAEHHRRNVSMQSTGDTKSNTGTPPPTPPRKRESGGFPRISIPKLPTNFWEGQVNTLH